MFSSNNCCSPQIIPSFTQRHASLWVKPEQTLNGYLPLVGVGVEVGVSVGVSVFVGVGVVV